MNSFPLVLGRIMPHSLSRSAIKAILGPVSSAVIDRGLRYQANGAVFDFAPIDDVAYATVAGSYDYEVTLSLVQRRSDDNRCTCPYFEDHGVCKHLVAVLCEAHAQGTLMLDEPGTEIDRLQRELIETFGDTVLALGMPKATTIETKAKPTVQSDWRERLAVIALSQQPKSQPDVIPADAELMYILDLSRQQNISEELAIEIAYRTRLANGQWSVIKRKDFSRYDLPHLPNQADRQALALLMGAGKGSYRYGQHHFDTTHYPFLVANPAQPPLLSIIGPTGRCFLREYGQGKDDVIPLAWDETGPWMPSLELKAEAPSGDYELAMQLRRGDEAIPLSKPRLLTGGGIMLHEQALSQVSMDQAGVAEWIGSELNSGQARLRSRAGQGRGITVPRAEAGALVEQLLSMPETPQVVLPEALQFETILGTPRPRLTISRPDDGHWEKRLTAQMSVGYGEAWLGGDDARTGVYRAQTRQFIERDRDQERAFTNLLHHKTKLQVPNQYNREHAWDFRLKPKDLAQTAAELTEAGWLVEADGKLYRNGATMNLSVQSGIDWFELHGEARFGDQTAPLPELLEALRSGSRTVLLDDGSHGLLPEDWLKRYGMLGDLGQAKEGHLRFDVPQAMLLDAMLAELPSVDIDAQFRKVRDRIQGAGQAKPKAPPRTFKGELRPYQRDGLGWMHQLHQLGLGGCLADDMGLGKTVQVLSMLEARRTAKPANRPEHPSLIVVPKSLVFNWQQEAARFTPNLSVLNHTGKERFEQHGLTRADLNASRPQGQGAGALDQAFHAYDVVLTTYGTLRQDIAAIKDIRFDYAVLDEAQAIKNHNTASAKAARLIHADHRLAVSGTPIENHLGELWSLFAFINPGMLGHGQLGKQLQSGKGLADESRQVLAKALRPYILRRTKGQVATDLPEKTEQTLYCELPPKQRRHYNQLRDHYRKQLLGRIEKHGLAQSKIQVLEALLRLRQAACHPGLVNAQHAKADSAKLDQLMEQLQPVLDEGHKALVFSQFTEFLGLLRKRLDPMKVNYEYLDGKTRKRQDKVERFQKDPDCKLFLISLKAGGTGLNLTAADYVFLLDPWWNPAVEAQAIDRTHRIGQTKQVFAYRLIAKDTVEEKVLALQQTKRELADALIGQDNSVLRDLTREDLDALFA